MEIRRATEQDIPGISKLLREVLEIHAAIRPDIFISGTKKYTEEELKKILKEERTPVFVAVDDLQEVLGYCFCILEERKGHVNMQDMHTLYIDDLCVEAGCRGQHIGEKLYGHVCDFAKRQGCYNLTLHVWEGNDRARHFYEKMGFGIQKTLMERILPMEKIC